MSRPQEVVTYGSLMRQAKITFIPHTYLCQLKYHARWKKLFHFPHVERLHLMGSITRTTVNTTDPRVRFGSSRAKALSRLGANPR
jgi:hypothetical protein